MCLYSITGKPLIAKKNLICYKRVYRPCSNRRIILTPYQGVELLCNSLLIDKKASKPSYADYLNYYIVGKGYFHAFQNFDTATQAAMFLYATDIVKCIIPKGAKYYLGINGDICTSKIIIGTNETSVHYSLQDRLKNFILNLLHK